MWSLVGVTVSVENGQQCSEIVENCLATLDNRKEATTTTTSIIPESTTLSKLTQGEKLAIGLGSLIGFTILCSIISVLIYSCVRKRFQTNKDTSPPTPKPPISTTNAEDDKHVPKPSSPPEQMDLVLYNSLPGDGHYGVADYEVETDTF